MTGELDSISIPDAIEESTPHIHRAWYAAHRIVAYEVLDISPDIVTEWANLAVETIRTWTPGQPYLALHDISRRGVSMKYGSLHVNAVNPAITDAGKTRVFLTPAEEAAFEGRIALLMSLQFSGFFTRVLATKEIQQRFTGNVQHRVFTQKIPALRWLAEGIDTEQPGTGGAA